MDDFVTLLKISVALATNEFEQVLLVRKKNTDAFMQPGGKIESGELPLNALGRELHEELGLTVDLAGVRYLGQANAPAAFESGVTLEAEVFALKIAGVVRACGEIDEILWIDPANTGTVPLAPLTERHILPMALSIR